jgi:chromosome segregation ATPase
MAKVNFTKVEQALNAGLIKMEAQHLLYLADLASSFGEANSEAPPILKPAKFQIDETHEAFINNLKNELNLLRKKDKQLESKLGFNKAEIGRLLENAQSLTSEEWDQIREIKRKLNEHKKEMKKKLGTVSDQDIVSDERKKQATKRFNIKDDWLPL